jgi:hypothetical protein
MPVVDGRPPRIIRLAGEDVLDVGRAVPDRGDIGPAQRQCEHSAAHLAGLDEPPQHSQRALLAGDHDPPRERGLQRESVRPQEFERQRRVGHLGDHRLDLRWQAVGHRPLHVPQVTAAHEHDRAAEPRLLHHPSQGGHAVLALVPQRVELPAGAERAAGALQQHLEPALGQRDGHPRGDQPPPSVRAAHQGELQRAPAVPRRLTVGQQLDAVRHGDPQVPLGHHVPGQRRVQPQHPLHEMTAQPHPRCCCSAAGR